MDGSNENISSLENDRRMGLNDMKMMVHEGQLLLESEQGSDGLTASAPKVHNRELQKAQTIVELADNVSACIRDIH